MIITWLVDLIWMVYWIPLWNSDEMKDWQKGLHNFVILFSVINFLMKMAVIIMLGFTERAAISSKMTEMKNLRKPGSVPSEQMR